MAAAKKWWKRSSFDWYAFGMLIALELLMSFTFLGYIHIPPLSVTTAYMQGRSGGLRSPPCWG